MGTSSPSACFFLESRDRIQPLRAWGESRAFLSPHPAGPVLSWDPWGGWAQWSQRRELESSPVWAGPECWDGSDPAPVMNFDPQRVSHSQARVWRRPGLTPTP